MLAAQAPTPAEPMSLVSTFAEQRFPFGAISDGDGHMPLERRILRKRLIVAPPRLRPANLERLFELGGAVPEHLASQPPEGTYTTRGGGPASGFSSTGGGNGMSSSFGLVGALESATGADGIGAGAGRLDAFRQA